ncbi:hypothetical protein [Methylorubrum extorquens]|nr:hypothetical protein [Methylorubrum extorquens]
MAILPRHPTTAMKEAAARAVGGSWDIGHEAYAQAVAAAPADLLPTLLASLQRVTAERDAAIKTCEMAATSGGFYARHAENAEARAVRAEDALATAAAEAARLRGEVEARDLAILLLLPFVDYAAGEGLMFVETEDGEHPEMDAADIMAAAAKALGLELGSDAYLALLPKGYFAIRTALARAATEEA